MEQAFVFIGTGIGKGINLSVSYRKAGAGRLP